MVKNSLGLIEVVGLAAALEAADAAMKAANVELIGYELTKGGGLVLVKLCGDVGAVKTAVEAGKMAGSKVNKVWSTHVIPRPHQQLSCILEQEEILEIIKQPVTMVVIDSQISETEIVEESEVHPELPIDTETEVEVEAQAKVHVESQEGNYEQQVIETPFSELIHENSEIDGPIVIVHKEKRPSDICNLCNDPVCRRKKGDPKITCMYHGKNNKEAE